MTNGLAAFDFDGTVTTRDTLVPFLWRAGGVARNLAGWPSLAPLALVRDQHLRRADAKQRMLRRTMGGRPLDEIQRLGAEYAEGLPRLYRPSSLERIEWHLGEGHELVLITASLRVYAEPAAERLGFHHVIAVDLEVDDEGRVTGALVGPNVRGPEKAVRLRAHLGQRSGETAPEIWAYGDSRGDLDLLAMADHPTWVGRRAGRR